MLKRALTLGLAAAVDARLGDPPTAAHPVGLVGRATRGLRQYAPEADVARRQYGWAVAFGVPFVSALAAGVAHGVLTRRHTALGGAFDVAMLSLMTSSRALLGRAAEVQAALEAGSLAEARALAATHL